MASGGIGAFLATFVDILFNVLTFAIIVRSLMSWFNPRPDNPIVRFVYEITEPVLGPLGRIVPRIGMIDISPIVAILLLNMIGQFLVQALRMI
jgi:YggT family protein